MSPSANTNGGFERDAEDAPRGFGFPNGHARGSSASMYEHESHRGELETREFVSRKPASRFATIIEANDDYKKILEVMGKLRVFDVDHEFSLPQLVVCGEQSAGKSSVLEAISGIPFPRKGSQCTRFVTQ
jgi:Dynamin family